MSSQELEMLASEVIRDFEGGELERHEIHARLHQILERMRAFGMTPPDDLVQLERELADEFSAEGIEQEKK